MGKFFGQNKKRKWLFGFISGIFHFLFRWHRLTCYNDLDAVEWWWCDACILKKVGDEKGE
jgi:hypothetical protein